MITKCTATMTLLVILLDFNPLLHSSVYVYLIYNTLYYASISASVLSYVMCLTTFDLIQESSMCLTAVVYLTTMCA